MKKLSILILALILGAACFAQKESGKIYSQHELIDKTQSLWNALIEGNSDAYVNHFADSVVYYQNGKPGTYAKEAMAGFVNYWSAWENLKFSNDHQSTPDALIYNNMMFVQDWLVFAGIHRETGINNDFHIHSLYAFDDNGKIKVMYSYFDPNYFEEVNGSSTTTENGELFINHPYINTVRKMLNAYVSMDVDEWRSFYAAYATFRNSTMKSSDKNISIETRIKSLKEYFASREEMKLTQIGYPDCLHYAKGDSYSVFSWWNLSITEVGGKSYDLPLMLTHVFNKDGKITSELAYFSSNHSE